MDRQRQGRRVCTTLLIDEGSKSNIMFSNCFEKMKLPQDVITTNTGDVYGFEGNKSNPVGRVPLDVTLMAKVLTVDFVLMDCNLLTMLY